MSEPSIPLFNGDLKPVTLGDVIRLAERTNKYVERANERLGPNSPISGYVRGTCKNRSQGVIGLKNNRLQ